MNNMKIMIALIVLPVFVAATAPVGSIYAVQNDKESEQAARLEERKEQASQKVQERKAAIIEKIEEKKAQQKNKLDTKKQALCEKRASKINLIIDRRITQNEKRFSVFTRIADKTQAFYEEKGYFSENYDALVENVIDKQTAVQAAINVAKETDFICEEQDANHIGTTVKELMAAQKTALKEYKNAIKDLIVDVKQAAKVTTTQSETPHSSPGETTVDTDNTSSENNQ